MFKNRLIYRLFMILLIFAVASILPVMITTHKEISGLTEGGDAAMIIDRIMNNFITISFYVFILAFLLSLFFSRKMLLPVRELHRGAMAIRDGNLDTTLSAPSSDETGEVIVVFNEMVASLRNKTEELSQKNKDLTAINSIADLLSRSLDAKDTIRNVVRKLIDMVDMDDGGVFLMDRKNMALVCYQTENTMPFGDNIPSKVVETGQVHACSDITKEDGPVPEWLIDSDIKGCCCIPLKGKEGVLGALYLISFEPHQFTDEEKRILSSVGDMTGIALENIRLFEDMSALYEYHHRRRKQEHNNLLRLASGLASVTDLKEAIDATLNLVRDSLNADFACLAALDEYDNLAVKSFAGDLAFMEGSSKTPSFSERFGADSIERCAIEKKNPMYVSALSMSRFSMAAIPGHESAVSIPIYSGEKPLGVFSLYFKSAHEFKEEDVHFLQIVSSILSVAIERSEFYERMLLEKGMAEVVFNSMSDGLYTVDTNRVITSVNRAGEKMLGIPAENLIGRKCMDVIMHRDVKSDELLCGSDECPLSYALKGARMSKDMAYIEPSGRRVSFSVSCAPMIDARGALIGAVEVFRDITREKEIDMMKTEFVRTVSHEFRTPLSAIIGMTEMLLEREVDGKRAEEYIHTILNEGIRLSGMVSDLLDIARIESGDGIFNESDIDFNLLLHDIKKIFSDIIRKKKIRMETHVSNNVKYFRGDREKLKQLFVNLVGNSVNYSDEGCIVDVGVNRKSDAIQITVSDTGWGIPDADIPYLTKKFFRGKHSIKTKGTGLGLSICNEIVQLHRGTLDIRNRHGKGTTATVTLPLNRPAVEKSR